MLEKRSTTGEVSAYDIYSIGRDIAIFAIGFLVVNIDMVQSTLQEWGVPTIAITFAIYTIVELGRKYSRDYTKG
jgi:hypothetical protein